MSLVGRTDHVSPLTDGRRVRWVWYGLLTITGGVFGLAMLPPVLPPGAQEVLRGAFAAVCHQMPGRTPRLGGEAVALCDRCSGIYFGLVLGVAGAHWGQRAWSVLGRHGRYVLLGALVPLGLDWVGPLVHLWANGPISRASTGLLFGVVAASYVTDRLLRREARASGTDGPA